MSTAKQFVKYASVGIVGTTAHYSVLIILVHLLSVNAVLSSSVGFVIGAFVNYYLNFRITFRSNKKHSDALPKFFTVALFGFFLNAGVMFILIDLLSVHYFLSQMLATGVVLLGSFGANRIWTFREHHADDGSNT